MTYHKLNECVFSSKPRISCSHQSISKHRKNKIRKSLDSQLKHPATSMLSMQCKPFSRQHFDFFFFLFFLGVFLFFVFFPQNTLLLHFIQTLSKKTIHINVKSYFQNKKQKQKKKKIKYHEFVIAESALRVLMVTNAKMRIVDDK